jgi:hypothetical protein
VADAVEQLRLEVTRGWRDGRMVEAFVELINGGLIKPPSDDVPNR